MIMQYSIKQATVEQIFNKFAEEDGHMQMDWFIFISNKLWRYFLVVI